MKKVIIKKAKVKSCTIDKDYHKAVVEIWYKKNYSIIEKPLEYDPAYLNLPKNYTRPEYDYDLAENMYNTFYNYRINYKCFGCKQQIGSVKYGNEYAKHILDPLFFSSRLKLKVCTNCAKAYKILPPTKVELEKAIKNQIRQINKFIKDNEGFFIDIGQERIQIKAVKITSR